MSTVTPPSNPFSTSSYYNEGMSPIAIFLIGNACKYMYKTVETSL